MSQGDLMAALRGIRLLDGRPDGPARKSQLSALVEAFSSDEIRHVRDLLNGILLYEDICPKLPVELLLHVARNLSLEDVFSFRLVSKAWCKAFSSPDFFFGVIKQHFPRQFTQHLPIATSGDPVAKAALLRHFHSIALAHLKRKYGCYSSKALYRHNFNQYDRRRTVAPSEQRYNNGRLAFRTHSYGIIVKDLRTGHSRQFIEANRADVRIWYLSDQYLVFMTNGPATLCAWSLVNDDLKYNIRLPTSPMTLSGRGNLIGIVTFSSELLLWTIGSALVSIDLRLIKDWAPNPECTELGIFFPKDRKEYFVTYVDFPREGTNTNVSSQRLIVLECLEDKIARHFFDIPSSICRIERNAPSLGGDTLVWCLYDNHSTSSSDGNLPLQDTCSNCQLATCGSSSKKTLDCVVFDSLAGTFAFQTYHFPVLGDSESELLYSERFFWRDQALVPIQTQHKRFPDQVELNLPLLVAIGKCDAPPHKHRLKHHYDQQNVNIEVPSVASGPEKNDSINILWRWSCDTQFVEDSSRLFDATNDLADTWTQSINVLCDDEFVILLSNGHGMAVWCFDQDSQPRQLPPSR